MNEPPVKKDESELGALWGRISANGDEMLTGEINGVRVVCFRNKSDNPKAPLWRVLKAKPLPLPPAPAPITDADIPF